MHVLFLAEDFPTTAEAAGGVRVSVRQQADALARTDRVTVVVLERHIPSFLRFKSAEHHTHQSPGTDDSATDGSGNLAVHRYRYWHVPVLWMLTEPILLVVLALWACLRHARDAAVIHAHRVYPMGIPAMALARLLRRPEVVTAYGSDIHMFAFDGNVPRRLMTRHVLRKAGTLVAVSQSLVDAIRQLRADGSHCHHVPSGVDVDRFRLPGDLAALRARLELPTGADIFLAINLFVPIKAHDVLIDAFARLLVRRPSAYLVMTGDGPLRPAMRERTHGLGIADRVRFLGFVDYQTMPDWIGASDALVLPSRNEGMPLSILEGFACGKPLIGTRVGGIPELVDRDGLGILVAPDDVEALAEAMERAMQREWDPAAIRERALAFGWPAIAARLRLVYGALRRPRAEARPPA